MSSDEDITKILVEIRDNQRLSLKRQEEHLQIAREQVTRSQNQIDKSIELQKEAMDKVKKVSRVAVPGIILCIALIAYLVIRYL